MACGGGGGRGVNHHAVEVNACGGGVHFGNRSGLSEKESSPRCKHLDKCLLQHEKQLEVSGSGRGWGVSKI